MSFIAFALLLFVPFLGMGLAPCDGSGCNVSDSPLIATNGTNFTLVANATNETNGTLLLDANTTDTSLAENQANVSNESSFENETASIEAPPANETLFNETANLTENQTNETGLEIVSSDSVSTVLSNGNGTIEVSASAYSQLENNESVRVIATSDAPQSPDFTDSNLSIIDTVPSSNLTVIEINQSDLSSLIDTGVSNVYPDTEMEASLSDTIPLIGADIVQSQLGYTGAGETICLLDTGVDTSLASLNGTAISGYDFVNNDADASDDSVSRHGTVMASIIHAIAPQAQIIAVKVLGSDSKGFSSDIIAGIDYCQQNTTAKIILMSFGGGNYTEHCDNADLAAQAASDAAANGIFVVSSTGNRGLSAITAPACGENVTAVSATNKDDSVWGSSNINSMVKLLAPGAGVTVLGSPRSGTSISAAHVAGAAALLLEANASFSAQDAQQQLISTGKPIAHDGNTYPRLDIYAALTGTATNYTYQGTQNQSNETGNYTYDAAATCNCGDTLTANCALTGSITASGITCLTVGAPNVTIDCAGYSITGDNTSNHYGVYSNQFNTTIRNCNINNFATGIFFNGASNGSIINVTSNSTRAATENDGMGILISSSNYNTIANSTATASTNTGIKLDSSSNNNIINITVASAFYGGLLLQSASNNILSNCRISGQEPGYGSLELYSGANNNIISNSTVNGIAGTYAVTFKAGANTGGITADIDASETGSGDARDTAAVGGRRACRTAVEREADRFAGHRR